MTIERTEHLRRLATGIIGLIVITSLYYYLGHLAVQLFTVIVGLCAFSEFVLISISQENSKGFRWAKLGVAELAGLIVLFAPTERYYFAAFFLVIIFTLGIYRLRENNPKELMAHRYHLQDLFVVGFGLFYVLGFLRFLPELHLATGGPIWILGLFAIIWVGDIFAYYGGHTFGRHKLALVISPGKTWEGSIFGLLGALLVGFGLARYLPEASLSALLLICVATGAISQLGDLFESLLKRVSGVKDSGRLLPGHGGFLDRFDSLILATPFFFFSLKIFGYI